VEGYILPATEDASALRVVVGSDYARTMGIPVVAGRDIRDDDQADGLPVALVNETFAASGPTAVHSAGGSTPGTAGRRWSAFCATGSTEA
jgi:hypothetical protein